MIEEDEVFEQFLDDLSLKIENNTFKLKDLLSVSMVDILAVWETSSAERFFELAYTYRSQFLEDEFYLKPIETIEIIKVVVNRFHKISYWIENKNCSINMRVFMSLLMEYCPEFTIDGLLTDDEVESKNLDKRLMKNAPTNMDKIKALKEFCPELMAKLLNESKEIQMGVVHLITGVNKEDSYKYTFGGRAKDVEKRIVNNLDFYRNHLNILKR